MFIASVAEIVEHCGTPKQSKNTNKISSLFINFYIYLNTIEMAGTYAQTSSTQTRTPGQCRRHLMSVTRERLLQQTGRAQS